MMESNTHSNQYLRIIALETAVAFLANYPNDVSKVISTAKEFEIYLRGDIV